MSFPFAHTMPVTDASGSHGAVDARYLLDLPLLLSGITRPRGQILSYV